MLTTCSLFLLRRIRRRAAIVRGGLQVELPIPRPEHKGPPLRLGVPQHGLGVEGRPHGHGAVRQVRDLDALLVLLRTRRAVPLDAGDIERVESFFSRSLRALTSSSCASAPLSCASAMVLGSLPDVRTNCVVTLLGLVGLTLGNGKVTALEIASYCQPNPIDRANDFPAHLTRHARRPSPQHRVPQLRIEWGRGRCYFTVGVYGHRRRSRSGDLGDRTRGEAKASRGGGVGLGRVGDVPDVVLANRDLSAELAGIAVGRDGLRLLLDGHFSSSSAPTYSERIRASRRNRSGSADRTPGFVESPMAPEWFSFAVSGPCSRAGLQTVRRMRVET